MGAFYGNITLKGPSQEQVAEALRGRLAIVTPSIGNYTVLFDAACDDQNDDEIQALTSRLSRDFGCPALAVIVHDDDIMAYSLYIDGDLTDSYNSCPSYFNHDTPESSKGPTGGDAVRLCAAFAADNQRVVERILRKSRYAFETERHADLVRAFGLPDSAVGTALASFDDGECPEGLCKERMMRASDPPPVEDEKQRWDRQFYERLGEEDPSQPCKRQNCGRGKIVNSLLCRRHHFEMVHGRECPFDD